MLIGRKRVARLLKEFRGKLGEEAAGVPLEARAAVLPWCGGPGSPVYSWFVEAVGLVLRWLRGLRGLDLGGVARELQGRFGHPASKASVSQTEGGQSPPSWSAAIT